VKDVSPPAAPLAALGLVVVGLSLSALGSTDAPPVGPPPLGIADGGPLDFDAGPVDLATASAQQLEHLPGIGPALAGRIVEHRDQHGFRSVDELVRVRGIGPRTLAALRARVTLSIAAGDGDAAVSALSVP
jgi:competence protein ComEA